MAVKTAFNNKFQLDFNKPIEELKQLERSGFIRNLKIKTSSSSNYKRRYFYFDLAIINLCTPDYSFDYDLSKYAIKIQFGDTPYPLVFCTNIVFQKNTPHIYHNGALCLYKQANMKWTNEHSISDTLYTWICTWFYFYEQWLTNGHIWEGPEAPH